MTIAVGVLGAGGRMGAATCDAVEADPDLNLVARVGREDPLEELARAGTEVAVDFTTPDAVLDNIKFCLQNDIHCVVGTTGIEDSHLKEIHGWSGSSRANALVAPNFALGAVLMMRFAAQAAPYFTSAEIVERHHERKLDAPSGTSLRTAALMNEARDGPWPSTSSKETLEGSRGGDVGGIHIHSLRVRGSVAHQEVVLGSTGETLTIRHDSIDRASFMPGVVLAIKKVSTLEGLVVGLEHVLDL